MNVFSFLEKVSWLWKAKTDSKQNKGKELKV